MGYSLFILGVSGTGKTTVGQAVSSQIGKPFIEGDEFHPSENVKKMSSGIPLNDDDRFPWLAAIAQSARETAATHGGVVVACSGLKKAYRDILRQQASEEVIMVLLEGEPALLRQRHEGRKGHFMPPSMLDSQLDTLEVPTSDELVLSVHVDASISDIAHQVIEFLNKLRNNNS